MYPKDLKLRLGSAGWFSLVLVGLTYVAEISCKLISGHAAHQLECFDSLLSCSRLDLACLPVAVQGLLRFSLITHNSVSHFHQILLAKASQGPALI